MARHCLSLLFYLKWEVIGLWEKKFSNFLDGETNKDAAICSLCKPIEIRNLESCKAFDPLDHFTLLQSISNSGIDINELFQTPGLTSKQFLLDWLHIVDLGVAADFMGNVFHHLIASGNHLPGNNVKERVKSLFHRIQSYYKTEGVENKLPTLTVLMIRKKASSSPKLRAKAAEARGLITIAKQICDEFLADDNALEYTIKMAATELWQCYSFLSKNLWNHQSMLLHGRKFLLLRKSLENETDHRKIKPKHHSFLDLLLQNSCPSDSWTYWDEDFRGFLAHLGAVKGGSHNPYSIGMRHECSAKFSSTSDSRAEVTSFAARIWDKEVSSLLLKEVQDLLAIENLRRNFKEEFFKNSTLI